MKRASALWLAGALTVARAAGAQDAADPADVLRAGLVETAPQLDEELHARHAEAGALDAEGLPRPEFWRHDPDGPARDWLNKPHIDPADLAARPAAYADVLAEHGLLLDLPTRTLSLRGTMLHDETTLEYPIEYLVVTEQGKVYEAAVIVRAQPSVINACLRALDLAPGTATTTQLKDPQPPREVLEAGELSPFDLVPGHGPLVGIDLSWLDDAGRPHLEPLESLLINTSNGVTLDEHGWIFTGSSTQLRRQGSATLPRYQADLEGNVVAIYLADARVCLLERNDLEGIDDFVYYTLDPERAPRRDTPVTLVFRPTGERVDPRPLRDLYEVTGPPPEAEPVGLPSGGAGERR